MERKVIIEDNNYGDIAGQNKIDKLFADKEKQDSLIEDIIGQKNKDFEKLLETEKTHHETASEPEETFVKTTEKLEQFTPEELTYMSSACYSNYNYIFNMINSEIYNMYNDLIARIQFNLNCYKSIFVRDVSVGRRISGIGYPVPDKFLKQLELLVLSKINEISKIDNVYYEVEVIPVEYFQNNNHVRKINSYLIVINMKEKTKNKVKKNIYK